MRRGPGKRALHAPPTQAGSLDLIHTNNSPKPVSMRVSGGLPIEKLREVSMRPWRKVLAGPLGYLLIRRIYAE